ALGVLGGGDGETDLDAFETGEGDDLARGCVGNLDAIKSFIGEQLSYPRLLSFLRTIEGQQHPGIADMNGPPLDTTDAQAPEVWRMVDRRDEHLERAFVITWRRRHVSNDGIKERREIHRGDIHIHRRHTFARRSVHHGGVELAFVRFELDEKIENLVVNAHRIGSRPVDLVDHHDRRTIQLQRLPEDEAGLGHRAIERVDDEQHPIDHAQNALDLTAKIRMAWRINDVDFGAMPAN